VGALPGSVQPGLAFAGAARSRTSHPVLGAMLGLPTVAAAGCVDDGYAAAMTTVRMDLPLPAWCGLAGR
jgi:hypothetical protein